MYFYDFIFENKDVTGKRDLAMISDNQAILLSLKNLLLTNEGDHFMDPDYGINMNNYLFNQISFAIAMSLHNEIAYKIEKYEPRILNLLIDIIPNDEDESYEVNLYFNTNFSTNQNSVQIVLNRIR